MGLAIAGDDGAAHPAKIRLYKDRPAVCFESGSNLKDWVCLLVVRATCPFSIQFVSLTC